MRRARPLLGTYVEVAAVGLPDSVLGPAVDAAFDAVELVQRLMSFHEPASDLSRLNRRAAIEPVEVHPWTARVIGRALALFHATDGLFDCAIGAELLRWELLPDHGFAGIRSGQSSAVRFVSKNRIVFDAPIAIDLGGIAKGFAVDRAVAMLRQHGVRKGLVNAGHHLRIFGLEACPVHVRDPLDPQRIRQAGWLSNGSIATSSAAETLKVTRGAEVSALVCAATREPLIDRNAYSVVAPTCIVADALTKVLAQTKRTDIPCFQRLGATGFVTIPAGTDPLAARDEVRTMAEADGRAANRAQVGSSALTGLAAHAT
jgi:FAD:protein FMN transferase